MRVTRGPELLLFKKNLISTLGLLGRERRLFNNKRVWNILFLSCFHPCEDKLAKTKASRSSLLQFSQTMSTNKTKKVKMATKSCPECDQQIPVACKSCPCGYVFISRKLLNAKLNECSSTNAADKLEFKRRRTERVRRERPDGGPTAAGGVGDPGDGRRQQHHPRANGQADPIRRGRGRPKTVGVKKHEDDKEKQEKEVDVYAGLSDERAFVFSVALAEINRKILAQTLIL
ncbi:UPF0547 protein C16orf87 homolog [Festucalex cinctus]